VGTKSLPRVQAAGIFSFGDARRADEARLFRAFGRHGVLIRDRAAGIDERPVIPDREEKSISAEDTFLVDIEDKRRLETEIVRLADRTASRLRALGLVATTVRVKIRRADFKTYSRQCALGTSTHETAVISSAARRLLAGWLKEQPRAAVRLLGVGVSNLTAILQPDLFSGGQADPKAKLDEVVDGIRDRFGKTLLTRASLLPKAPGRSGA
jgi:DNA polymerase IV